MAKLKIVRYGESVLRKKAVSVAKIDGSIERLAWDMLETMYSAFGIGLAAPQVGASLSLCVVDIDPDRKSPFIMINPKIVSLNKNVLSSTVEGCLSLPGFYELVGRSDEVTTEYTDVTGRKIKMKVQGLLAVAIQHEIDHLNAKIFIDYLPEWKIKAIEKEIKRKRRIGDW